MKKKEKRNIYHCCIQKTGSQWIKSLLSDRLVYKAVKMKTHIPHKNFLGKKDLQHLQECSFPANKIITPLYIGYYDFLKIPKQPEYKSFFVMRDPRDFIISWYFSTKFSHKLNPFIIKEQKVLEKMNDEEAFLYLCKTVFHKNNLIFKAVQSWYENAKNNREIAIFRYEDLVGEERGEWFARLMVHLDIGISKENVEHLLEKYSFQRLSGGRKPGNEDIKSHYRKGVSGDWKNYFNEKHKEIFKKNHGQLLIDLNYEKNRDW